MTNIPINAMRPCLRGIAMVLLYLSLAGCGFCPDGNIAVYNAGIPPPELQLFAGGIGGKGNYDGTGADARFSEPSRITFDAAGNAYVAEFSNHTIRKITPAGEVTTFAGTISVAGNANGIGTAASFYWPWGIAFDPTGSTLYVAEYGNHTIRKIDIATRVVTTFAGTAGSSGSVDATGTAARFNGPIGLTVDAAGNLYVTDATSHRVRMITPGGVVTTLASFGSNLHGIAADTLGNLYIADVNNNKISKLVIGTGIVTDFAGSGALGGADGTGTAAQLGAPDDLAIDAAGTNMYVAGYQTIRKIELATGIVTTLAGTAGSRGSADGVGAAARFREPRGIGISPSGDIHVADSFNHLVRKVTPAGVVTTLAGLAANIGSADGAGAAAQFNFPRGLIADSAGNLYVADTGNHTIRKISSAGVTTTFAGTAGASGSTDASGAAARFKNAARVAIDAAGTLYVSDSGNYTIRTITPSGAVSTLAGQAGSVGNTDGTGAAAHFSSPGGIVVDASGNVYVTDSASIRKITPAGMVTTFAGAAFNFGSNDGTGTAARFSSPKGITIDAAGNLYVADTLNHTIRKITPAAVVTKFAGSAGSSGSADGNGAAARFNFPAGIAADGAGNLYVADTSNHTIRKITAAGEVTTVAGTVGSIGIKLSSLPGSLYAPEDVVLTGGNMLALISSSGIIKLELP